MTASRGLDPDARRLGRVDRCGPRHSGGRAAACGGREFLPAARPAPAPGRRRRRRRFATSAAVSSPRRELPASPGPGGLKCAFPCREYGHVMVDRTRCVVTRMSTSCIKRSRSLPREHECAALCASARYC